MPAGSGSHVGSRKRKASSNTNLGSLAINPSKLNFTEITENLLSKECAPGFEALATRFYHTLLPSMPSPSDGQNWSRVNFEFVPNIVAFPSLDELLMAVKAVEVREIRGRGAYKKSIISGPGGTINYSNLKLGVYCLQDIDPGVLVMEYLGLVQVPQLLSLNKKGAERVAQSHVMFIPKLKPTICIDARRQGSIARQIRRSCRPNCDVKIVLTGGMTGTDVHVCVFARNSVHEGEELLLPIDYDDGNDLFKYECACGNAELCLAPEASIPVPKIRQSSAPSFEMVDTLRPYQQRTKTPSQLVTSAAQAATTAKLSREERKLQQYIEQIEKMDHAEKKSASRKSSSGIPSSASALNIHGSGTRSPSSKASPRRPESPDSPRKTSVSPRKKPVEDESETSEEESGEPLEVAPRVEQRPERVEKPEKVKKAPKSPKKKPGPKPKKQKKVVPVSESSESETEDALATSLMQTRLSASVERERIAKLKKRLFHDEEQQLLDVGKPESYHKASSSSYNMIEIERGSSVSPFSTPPSNQSPIEADAGGSQPETPSKKRVSLSDYMKKRRATGDIGREDGELPQVSVSTQLQPEVYRENEQEITFSSQYQKEKDRSDYYSRPMKHPRPQTTSRYSGTGQYEMPPHLTPPPPLQSSAPIEPDQFARHSIPRSDSTKSTGYYDHRDRPAGYEPRDRYPSSSREPYPKDYPPPRKESYGQPSGASRYGYAPQPAPPKPSQPYLHASSSYDGSAGQPVYRPRPSLLKAAQDLPTRWEEAAAATGTIRPEPYYHRPGPSSGTSGRREPDEFTQPFEHRRSYPSPYPPGPAPPPSRHYDDYPPSSRDYQAPGYPDIPPHRDYAAGGLPPPHQGPPPPGKPPGSGWQRRPPGHHGPPRPGNKPPHRRPS